MTVRTRLAAVFSALTVLAVAGSVHAQFAAPTCTPPNCNPEVIQNVDISAAAQVASINISGSQKLGATFQTGALAPVLTAASDNLMYGNVGGTSTNGSLLLLQFGSADRLRVTLTGQMQLPLGSVGAPSYSFIGDTNTGLYSSVADSMSFATNGVARTTINNSGTTINSGVLSVPNGTNTAPSITFTGDTNTGIFRGTADTMSFVTNGVTSMTVSATNNVVIPGALTVTGTFTSSGGLSGNGSSITNLNASNITTGTLADARLSTNVTTYTGGGTFTGVNTFSNASNSFTGSGAGLTSLNASNISSGTLADARLSSNVALYNANGTFTGNNSFTGMTSYGSAVLVAGAGQNLLYGVADVTSTGNLLLLQTESAGVYTDRFRVSATGAVTAASFSGVGTALTALNASNLTSGTVPSARISGTYSNALTFSGANSYTNQSTFGSASLVVAAGQNLLYGNMDTTSAGSLLLLQNESVDRFRVAANGDTTIAGNLNVGGTFAADGSSITNINASNITTGTLADARLSTNVTTYTGGGTFTGVNTFSNASNSFTGSGAGLTSLNASNITSGTLSDTLLSTNVALLNGTNNFTGSVTIGGQGICLLNGTNCPMSGSGTANYVTKWTGANTLGNSIFRDDGTSAAIGNAPAANTLLVVGPTSLPIGFTATTNAANGVGIYGFGLGSSSIGLYGQGQGSGVAGVGGGGGVSVGVQGSGPYAGVSGTTANVWGYGVLGTVPSGSYVYGVYGITSSSQYSSAGVAGVNSGNGMGGYFQSNNGTTYALLAYNASAGYAFQAQGTSNFTGAVSMNSTLSVTGAVSMTSTLSVGGNTTLGNATTDRTTINGELVLGSMGATPTGVNGMTYYNSINNKFKCYENSVWVNCGAEEDTLATVSARGRFTNTYISVNGATAAFDIGTASYGSGVGVDGSTTAGGIGVRGSGGAYGVQGTGTTAGVYGNTSGTYGGQFLGGSYGVYGSGTTYGVYGTGTSYGGRFSGDSYGVYASSSGASGYGLRAVSSNSYGIYSSGYDTGGYFTNAWGVTVHIARYGGGMYSAGYDSGGHFYDLDNGTEGWVAEGGYAFRGIGVIYTTGDLNIPNNSWGTGSGWQYCEMDSATAGWKYCVCPGGSFVGQIAFANPGGYGIAYEAATYCYEP